ncbi:DUF2490 domain-containing protein [Hymenobacter latericus]|uniref:DUF2490 domain-containing protein n=1 Tax=Hymenobacter sp. YIM 151858-1 TaxID=2987688 RepID=UPI002226DBE8|nr:DUF2490 domain-containing protein [Hymenobacter sp. YIM 151858-1]UYZ59002.1 DUF2490 domain-containing protein [Hymenobacter sp. YIM 151858-1]
MRKRLFSAFLLIGLLGSFLSVRPAYAQLPEERVADVNRHLWLVHNGNVRFSERWSVSTEAQVRRTSFGREPQQNLVRGALDYHVSKNLILSAGYAFQKSFPYGDFPAAGRSIENRLQQQVVLRDLDGRVQVQHRYRLEQRWVRREPETDFQFTNRMRYQVRLALPLLGPRIKPGMPYLAASNEVMINFGSNVRRNIFDQNRLFAGVGYQASKLLTLEGGYLNQLVQHGSGRVLEHNHTLQLSLNLNLDLRAEAPAPAPLPTPAPVVEGASE